MEPKELEDTWEFADGKFKIDKANWEERIGRRDAKYFNNHFFPKAVDDVPMSLQAKAGLALGAIGDVKSVGRIGNIIARIILRDGRLGLEYSDDLVPVATEGLVRIGKPGLRQILEEMKGVKLVVRGIAYLKAVCAIGDFNVSAPVVDWLFESLVLTTGGPTLQLLDGEGKAITSVDYLRSKLQRGELSRIVGDYQSIILDIFSWKETSDPNVFDLSICEGAVKRLCEIKSPTSTNLLYKISGMQDFSVRVTSSTSSYYRSRTREFVETKGLRERAKIELKQRGKPRYEPSNYLIADAWKV